MYWRTLAEKQTISIIVCSIRNNSFSLSSASVVLSMFLNLDIFQPRVLIKRFVYYKKRECISKIIDVLFDRFKSKIFFWTSVYPTKQFCCSLLDNLKNMRRICWSKKCNSQRQYALKTAVHEFVYNNKSPPVTRDHPSIRVVLLLSYAYCIAVQ